MKDNLQSLLECWARAMLNAWTMGANTIAVMMEQGVVIDTPHGCKILNKDEVADNVERVVRNIERFDIKAGQVLRVHYGAIPGYFAHVSADRKAKDLKMSRTAYFNKLEKAIGMVKTGLCEKYGFAFYDEKIVDRSPD